MSSKGEGAPLREASEQPAKAAAPESPLQQQADALRFDNTASKVAVLEPTRDTQKIGDKPQAIDPVNFKAENQAMERIGGAIFRDSAAPHLERLKEADPAGNGAITSSGMKKYLSEANAYSGADKDSRYPGQFVRSVDALARGFDSPALKEFKDDKGNISRESFTAGILGRQDRLAKMETKPEGPAKPEAVQPKPEAAKFNDKVKELTTVRPGEGPYQAAARMLGAENGKASQSDIRALTKALKDQYIEDHGGKKNALKGLKRGESLIDSPEQMAKVMARIKDPALQNRLSAFGKKQG